MSTQKQCIQHCHICQKTIKSDKWRVKGWVYISYSDGDTFGYCPEHTLPEILNAVIANAWQEIGLYCDVEKAEGIRLG